MTTPLACVRQLATRLEERPSDFDALLEIGADRAFVLLGEASHGTAEFYRLRGEITRRLIEEAGLEAVLVEADGPGDDVAVGVSPGLFPGDDALVHRVFHPAMVLAYLMQLPISQEIGPTVTDVGQEELVTPYRGQSAGGPHSTFVRVLPRLKDVLVDLLEDPTQVCTEGIPFQLECFPASVG